MRIYNKFCKFDQFNFNNYINNVLKILFIHINHFLPQSKTRVIRTKYGRIQGFVSRVGRDAEQQRHVEIFLGVPYASPPIGDYR